MSDLPFIDGRIQSIASEINGMKRGGPKKEQKPHKLIMLLSVIDLFDSGDISSNRITFDDRLIATFAKNFSIYANDDDWCQPAPPFFHLRSSSFWKHKVKAGQEEFYAAITTSGGGSKRIIDNIEYAYLDDVTYSLFKSPETRLQIRKIVQDNLVAHDMNRIPALFHESFSLSRQSITQIMRAILNAPSPNIFKNKTKREEYFQKNTSLGMNYIKSMPYYCKGTGLITADFYIKPLGHRILLQDQQLDQASSQWLMHYHLSAPQGPGPAFWHALISTLFYAGAYFKAEDIADAIGNFVWQSENRTLASRSVQSTATIFLGTYTKPEGLNKLRLLETTESGRYRVCEPTPAPTWAIAYALVDFWMANYPKRLGIGIDVLLDSSFPKLFLIGRKRLVEVLEMMQEIGYVQLHRTAPPHQVVLIRQDTEGLLNKLYGTQ